DGEIASVDRLVAKLLSALTAKSLLDRSIVIVAADHGEALGDHGEDTHGLFLYDATLHVPLVVGLPARQHADARVDERVRLADVAASQNVAATRARVADAMDREMEQFIVHAAGAGGSSDKSTFDPDTAAKLAALGYVSGSASAAPPPTGVDPKDRVGIANAL